MNAGYTYVNLCTVTPMMRESTRVIAIRLIEWSATFAGTQVKRLLALPRGFEHFVVYLTHQQTRATVCAD